MSCRTRSITVRPASKAFAATRLQTGPRSSGLHEHIRRLLDSLRIYRIECPFNHDALLEAVLDTVRANKLDACYIRPIVLRGYGSLSVNPAGVPTHTFIAVWEWGAYLGEDAIENGVEACVSSWSRAAPNTFPTAAKAGGHYLNSQLIKMEAIQHGYTEGIALDPAGYVSEGSGENLFLVRDGIVYTPGLAQSILSGVTRDTVIHICSDLGLTVREQSIPREWLYIADEIFFTGTAVEITPVRSVDRISSRQWKTRPRYPTNPGPIFRHRQRENRNVRRLAHQCLRRAIRFLRTR